MWKTVIKCKYFIEGSHFMQPSPWKVKNRFFHVSLLNIETNSFNTIMQFISPNYAWKNGLKQIKTAQKNCCIGVFSTKGLRTRRIASKCVKKFFLLFFCYYLSYTWVGLIFLACPTFPKSFGGQFGHFDLILRTILSSIIRLL